MKAIPFASARTATSELLAELRADGWAPLVARPWNMHDPENTLWWIVPSNEWPAYKHGKFIFKPEPPGNALNVGESFNLRERQASSRLAKQEDLTAFLLTFNKWVR